MRAFKIFLSEQKLIQPELRCELRRWQTSRQHQPFALGKKTGKIPSRSFISFPSLSLPDFTLKVALKIEVVNKKKIILQGQIFETS